MVSMEKNCDIKGSVKNEATLKGTIGQSIVYVGGGDVDLRNYYTKDQVYNKDEVDNKLNKIDISGKEDIKNKVRQVEENDLDSLTEEQYLSAAASAHLIRGLRNAIDEKSDLSKEDIEEALKDTFDEINQNINKKADSADSLEGYGITNAYTQEETDNKLSQKQNTLIFDDVPTEGSSNPVTSDGIKTAVENALEKAKESGEFKGDKGDKGDKGEQGPQGIQGEKGDKGDDGYTPQKGVDYFTEEDIAYIVNAVLAALGDGNGDEPTIPENILLSADGLMLTDIDGIYLMPAISA